MESCLSVGRMKECIFTEAVEIELLMLLRGICSFTHLACHAGIKWVVPCLCLENEFGFVLFFFTNKNMIDLLNEIIIYLFNLFLFFFSF